MIRRRDFITLLGSAAAWPVAARAQQGNRVRRIGVLHPFAESDPEVQANLAAFRETLKKLGWIEGRNVQLDYRWGDAEPQRIRAYAKELVGLKEDVILVSTALALQPLIQETSSIPIVFTEISDPVGPGFVASLTHPGANLTGFPNVEPSIFAKLLEILKSLAPQMQRAAALLNPDQIPQFDMWHAIETAAPSLRLQVTAAPVRNASDIAQAIEQFAQEPNGGLIVLPTPATVGNRELIAALALRHRLPTASSRRAITAAGGLFSYGNDVTERFRSAAGYVDRILKGEKPADLPVQQPSKFELVINLKTGKALDIEVPPSLLAIADEVIE
jgi:putative ABC transport system substrate-binding protein